MIEPLQIAIRLKLLGQVERGNVLLFIGEQLNDIPAETGALNHLAKELAVRANLAETTTLTFSESAQAYEDACGHQVLVQLVRGRLPALGDAPELVYQRIASLRRCTVLMTTALGWLIERTFAAAGCPLQVVIRNEDG
jgi:hypothetical protein